MTDSTHAAAINDRLTQLREDVAKLASSKRFNDQELEAMYNVGHGLFAQKKYQEALNIFATLGLYRPLEVRYITAHAVCQKLLKRHGHAINIFKMAAMLEPNDPKTLMQIAECLLAQGQKSQAYEYLEQVLEMTAENTKYVLLRQRAQQWLALTKES
jgi:type III secretion system low calcium response chaperone LcrH/SycD